MKKYIVFCFESYYPNGGLEDIKGSFDSLESAKINCELKALEFLDADSAYVVDRDTWEIVYEFLLSGIEKVESNNVQLDN